MDFALQVLGQAFSFNVLLFSLLGTLAGIIAAAIPGFTILMAIVLVFPFTFAMTPLEGLATLIGVYVGGYSGGQISGILLGIPGTPSSICTVFDGYPMAKAGRAGEALGLGIFASFIGGILGGVVMVLFIKPVAEFGLKFGPWEIFGLILFSLTLIASLGGKSFFKGMASGFLGLAMAIVGTDNTGGVIRLTFGMEELMSGISLLPVLVGIFALPSLLTGVNAKGNKVVLTEQMDNEIRIPYRRVFKDLMENKINLLRSSAFGAFVGALPGEGGSVANFLAYDQAKRYSKKTNFGKGCPDGVVASESGNNACAGGSLIPTLSLGIPGSAADAVLLGVLMVHSIPPGPTLFKDNALLVYGLFVIFFVAHFYMLALQLGIGSRVFLKITQCPQWAMIPIVLVMCAIGCFALNNSVFDIWLFLILGVVGYLLDKAEFPLAPVVIGLLLGGMCEENLRQAFSISSDWTLFFTRPISLFFMVLTALSILYCAWPYIKQFKARKEKKEGESYGKVVLNVTLAAAFVLVAILAFNETMKLPGSTRWDAVGSRLIPEIFVAGFGIFSLGVLVQYVIKLLAIPKKDAHINMADLMASNKPIVIIFVTLAMLFVAMEWIGFYAAALIYLVAMHVYLDAGHFKKVHLITPIVCLLIVYGVFSIFLRMQLPHGIFY